MDKILINFSITKDAVNNMEWAEAEIFERAQDGDLKLYTLRPVLARFVINEKDEPVEHKRAMDLLGHVKVAQIKDVIGKFVEVLKGTAVPKENGTPSPSPIQAEEDVSASLDGSGL